MIWKIFEHAITQIIAEVCPYLFCVHNFRKIYNDIIEGKIREGRQGIEQEKRHHINACDGMHRKGSKLC